LLPGVLVVVTVFDVLQARQVLNSLEISEHPQCWRDTIRTRFPSIRLQWE
jgi:hypothetical protein